MNLKDYEALYYCSYCLKPKINEWGVQVPYCWSVECRERYKKAIKEKEEYERIKKIVKDVIQNEKLITITNEDLKSLSSFCNK